MTVNTTPRTRVLFGIAVTQNFLDLLDPEMPVTLKAFSDMVDEM